MGHGGTGGGCGLPLVLPILVVLAVLRSAGCLGRGGDVVQQGGGGGEAVWLVQVVTVGGVVALVLPHAVHGHDGLVSTM